jgi:two-component sensor histidine kinase
MRLHHQFLRQSRLRQLLIYAASIAVVSLALGLTYIVPPLHFTPTVLFFAAIVAIAWFGSRGPALLATVLSILFVDYFFVAPHFSVLSSLADVVRFMAFGSVAFLICFLEEQNQRIATCLRDANDVLELRVQDRTAELAAVDRSLEGEVIERRRAVSALRMSEGELRNTLDRVAASLKEKEVLLRELNHRVKNNLQVISSLFSIQAPKIQDPAAKELFKECQNRVRTIALVHDRLYAADNLARIDLADYYRDLVNNLFRSFGRNPAVIVPQVYVENTVLEFDHVIPCGLIVNELVSNSLKYAFPDGRPGEVRIDVRRHADIVTLTVADDGVGWSPPLRGKSGDGLQIVQALVDQLSGKLEMANGRGMTFTVTFPEPVKGETHGEYTNPRGRG